MDTYSSTGPTGTRQTSEHTGVLIKTGTVLWTPSPAVTRPVSHHFNTAKTLVDCNSIRKDTFPQGGGFIVGVALHGSVAARWASDVSTATVPSVPVPPSTIGHGAVPESPQRAVAPLPEAACPRGRLAVRTEPGHRRRRQRKRQKRGRRRNRRPVGPARAALLPVARWERAVSVRSVVRHHKAEVWRLVAHVRRQVVRMLVGFSCPWRSAAAGPVTIPPPDRHTLLGFIIADLSVFELALLSRGPTEHLCV